jgi:hypothetical protein
MNRDLITQILEGVENHSHSEAASWVLGNFVATKRQYEHDQLDKFQFHCHLYSCTRSDCVRTRNSILLADLGFVMKKAFPGGGEVFVDCRQMLIEGGRRFVGGGFQSLEQFGFFYLKLRDALSHRSDFVGEARWFHRLSGDLFSHHLEVRFGGFKIVGQFGHRVEIYRTDLKPQRFSLKNCLFHVILPWRGRTKALVAFGN